MDGINCFCSNANKEIENISNCKYKFQASIVCNRTRSQMK